jgi:hypothetical protein
MDVPPVSAVSGLSSVIRSFAVIIQLIVSSQAIYSFHLTPFFLQWHSENASEPSAACHLGPRRSPKTKRLGVYYLSKEHASHEQNHSLYPLMRGRRMKTYDHSKIYAPAS